ncbi:hypothetical protein KBX37_30300 [Micromonospora sp. U56]|uniref:hypothetical protein n=1 Tax=Micromonospora sp. U56 TaxID=2824900 RepID=UPI001B370DE4|nr:hypothetical protein [Micromonospora sp. U56]MBQ0897308.1 hypothetical protein [Micromonospora sp. U56]
MLLLLVLSQGFLDSPRGRPPLTGSSVGQGSEGNSAERLRALVAVDVPDDDTGEESVLALIKSVRGNVSLESMLTEIRKLRAVRAIGLPDGLFADVAPQVLAGWRSRAMVESPSHLRDHPEPLILTLLASLLHSRLREITDTLVELLISTVHRIGARADKKVTEELVNAFKRVTGKVNILFAIAEASLDRPDDVVRQVAYPAVTGGEQALRELVHEFKTKGPVYRRTVQTTLKASYSNHYRRGLIELLDVLEFQSSNATHRPVLDALDLIKRHADGRLTYYPAGETVPSHKGVLGDWTQLVFKDAGRGGRRVVRSVYEICTFQALRERLRCKEIRVVGADKWRNPDENLPHDFETTRPRTTSPCASRWTRPHSSTSSATRCARPYPRWTPSCRGCPGWRSSTGANRARSS